jgi:trans-aconitate methyltransferase
MTPTPRDVAEQWETAARRPDADALIHPSGVNPDHYRASGERAARDLVALAVKHTPDPHCWLDYGCGNGRILAPLTKLVPVAHGYDTSRTFVNQARDRGCTATTHAASLAPPYDVVFALAVLIHHGHGGGAGIIETLVDLTAPNGLVIFDLPVHSEPHTGIDWIDVTVWTAPQLDDVFARLPVEVVHSDRHDVPFTYAAQLPQTHILRRFP